MSSIPAQFRDKIGEVAYTPNQIVRMLERINQRRPESRIRRYIQEQGLGITLEELEINPKKESNTKAWVPKSNLQKIINGLEIYATINDLENAAYELGYQY